MNVAYRVSGALSSKHGPIVVLSFGLLLPQHVQGSSEQYQKAGKFCGR